jgi:hypothetical protein
VHLAQDRDSGRELACVVINFGFHKVRGITGPATNRLASQEGPCSLE